MAFTASLTGNIGRNPELKTFDSGKYKTELTVAVKQQDKDADAFWVQIDLWNKQADFAVNYIKKGDTIYAEGSIKEEKFQRRNGELGHKIVLQYARVELLKSAEPKQQSYAPQNVKATTGNWQSSPKVPEVDEIPF
tara:strand:- start:64 stop:471 length:408 start_codon:yes stop_codon:yes gene_type:complete